MAAATTLVAAMARNTTGQGLPVISNTTLNTTACMPGEFLPDPGPLVAPRASEPFQVREVAGTPFELPRVPAQPVHEIRMFWYISVTR